MTHLAPRIASLLLVFGALSGVSASAQDTQGPGSEAARYSFFKIQDTFVRLDSQTGQVAQCGHGGSGWSCKLAPDERAALESEIARIQGENAALKRELLARGIELPGNMKAEPAPGPMAKAPEPKVPELKAPETRAEPRPVPPRDVPQAEPPKTEPPSVRLPSDAEFDKVMNWMEKVWGRLVDMMARLQRDMERKTENKTEKPDKS